MGNRSRTLGILTLTAIYCFAICMVTKSFAHADFQNNLTTSQEQYFSTKLFCHTSPSENSVKSDNSLAAHDYKNPFNSLWATAKTIEQFFETLFSQYTTFSINLLIEQRKTEILFPFHTFW